MQKVPVELSMCLMISQGDVDGLLLPGRELDKVGGSSCTSGTTGECENRKRVPRPVLVLPNQNVWALFKVALVILYRPPTDWPALGAQDWVASESFLGFLDCHCKKAVAGTLARMDSQFLALPF